MKKTNPIETSVNEYLDSIKVSYQSQSAGTDHLLDDWECDGWLCQFTRDRRDYTKDAYHSERFMFYAGIGNRISSPFAKMQAASYNHKPIKDMPIKPKAARVLYSLVLEAECTTETFEEWCYDLGYDSDSRKALSTYDKCVEQTKKLMKVFNKEQIEHLRELLQDY